MAASPATYRIRQTKQRAACWEVSLIFFGSHDFRPPQCPVKPAYTLHFSF